MTRHIFEDQIERLEKEYKEGDDSPYTKFNISILKAVVLLDKQTKGTPVNFNKDSKYLLRHITDSNE